MCLTGLLSMQNERKLRVIEDIPLYERTSISNRTEEGGGGGSFFVINHWNDQRKFLLGVAFLPFEHRLPSFRQRTRSCL